MSKNDLGRAELQIRGLHLFSISTLTFALAVFRSKVHTLARPLLWSPAPGKFFWQPSGTQPLVVSEKCVAFQTLPNSSGTLPLQPIHNK